VRTTPAKIGARRRAVLAIVAAEPRITQGAIAGRLRGQGHTAGQVTVSRDAKALGLARTRRGWAGTSETTAEAALRLADAVRHGEAVLDLLRTRR